MNTNELPASILTKHPELIQILEALKGYHDGIPVTTRCPKCRETLQVVHMPEIHSLWVRCGSGCTNYHEKQKKSNHIDTFYSQD
jgi:hypothetical protein